jgi:predicted nucleic acid-binding Zn ribbon protein
VRRPGPRPLARALGDVASQARPQTLLARVQAAWEGVAGAVVAGEAAPVSERQGTVTCSCSSAVWANELELLETDLRARLNRALGGPGEGPVQRLRFSARGASGGPRPPTRGGRR